MRGRAMEKIDTVFIVMYRYQDIDGGCHESIASAAYLKEEDAQRDCDKRNSTWAKHEAPYIVLELGVEQ